MIERSKLAALRAIELLTFLGLRNGLATKLRHRQARLEALYRLRVDGY